MTFDGIVMGLFSFFCFIRWNWDGFAGLLLKTTAHNDCCLGINSAFDTMLVTKGCTFLISLAVLFFLSVPTLYEL